MAMSWGVRLKNELDSRMFGQYGSKGRSPVRIDGPRREVYQEAGGKRVEVSLGGQ